MGRKRDSRIGYTIFHAIPEPGMTTSFGGRGDASKPDGFCESDIADAPSDTRRIALGQGS
jgi:hypothetical protein